MSEYIEIAHTIYRVIHKYIRNEDIKRKYGADCFFTRKEIHSIECIGDHPGINLKSLSQMQGVTNGAASQMVSRLVEKGYVQRKDSPTSGAEISLYLTEKGYTAYTGHQEYHKQVGKVWKELLENLSEDTINEMIKFLHSFEMILDKEYESRGELK